MSIGRALLTSLSKVQQIPSTAGIKDQSVRKVVDALKLNVELYRGASPNHNPLDKAITLRDLSESGVVKLDLTNYNGAKTSSGVV